MAYIRVLIYVSSQNPVALFVLSVFPFPTGLKCHFHDILNSNVCMGHFVKSPKCLLDSFVFSCTGTFCFGVCECYVLITGCGAGCGNTCIFFFQDCLIYFLLEISIRIHCLHGKILLGLQLALH